MRKIDLYPEANIRYHQTLHYLEYDLHSFQAAHNLHQEMTAVKSQLLKIPDWGTPLSQFIPDIAEEFVSYRRTAVKNYLIIYFYDARHDTVAITHFFHSRQNYQALFQKDHQKAAHIE